MAKAKRKKKSGRPSISEQIEALLDGGAAAIDQFLRCVPEMSGSQALHAAEMIHDVIQRLENRRAREEAQNGDGGSRDPIGFEWATPPKRKP